MRYCYDTLNQQTSAQVIADSISGSGARITTLQITLHRFVLAEFNTHRVFSRNFRSSRAVPAEKLLQEVRDNPALPARWLSEKSGMQGGVPLNLYEQLECEVMWRQAAKHAVAFAEKLSERGLHKSWCNRLLEPFLYVHGVVTSTEWDNFFELRCHPDAQPEICNLANVMKAAMVDSKPELLYKGDWHLPYVTDEECEANEVDLLRKISTARCARVSYKMFDGTPTSIESDLKLYNKLVGSVPLHASPAEHQATPDEIDDHTDDYLNPHLSGNFTGWLQNRKFLELDMSR